MPATSSRSSLVINYYLDGLGKTPSRFPKQNGASPAFCHASLRRLLRHQTRPAPIGVAASQNRGRNSHGPATNPLAVFARILAGARFNRMNMRMTYPVNFDSSFYRSTLPWPIGHLQSDRKNFMKTITIAVLLLCALGASAQTNRVAKTNSAPKVVTKEMVFKGLEANSNSLAQISLKLKNVNAAENDAEQHLLLLHQAGKISLEQRLELLKQLHEKNMADTIPLHRLENEYRLRDFEIRQRYKEMLK
jgi:hypothetical protein